MKPGGTAACPGTGGAVDRGAGGAVVAVVTAAAGSGARSDDDRLGAGGSGWADGGEYAGDGGRRGARGWACGTW